MNEKKYSNLICWSPDGRYFTIRDQTRFAKELLPLYFKHNNMGSFVRQLNMYGFRKQANIENCGLRPESDEVSFQHPDFLKGEEQRLESIRRKKTAAGSGSGSGDTKATNGNQISVNAVTSAAVSGTGSDDVQNQLMALMQRQDALDAFRQVIQRENNAIWREIAFLRRENSQQKAVIERLFKFLIGVLPQMPVKRKAALINSIANSMPESKRLNTGSTSSSSSSEPSESISFESITGSILDTIRTGLTSGSDSPSPPNSTVTIQDITNGDAGEELEQDCNNSIIATHTSPTSSQLTESEMDILSRICQQINLVPTSSEINNGTTSNSSSSGGVNTVTPASNIFEVSEDFTFPAEEADDKQLEEQLVSELAETADLFLPEIITPDGIVTENGSVGTVSTNGTVTSATGTTAAPVVATSSNHFTANEPLDLDSLVLEPNEDEFVLPDLTTHLNEPDSDSFNLLI